MRKQKLTIIEGMDRVGKGTYIETNYDDKAVVKWAQIPDAERPKYGSLDYYEYNKQNIENMVNLLLNIKDTKSNIVLDRLFVSEYVYSSIHNRKSLPMDKYYNMLIARYDIDIILIRYTSYSQYKQRMKETCTETLSREDFSNEDLKYARAPYNIDTSFSKSV